MSFRSYILAFVPVFVAVDPLGMLPVFISLTRGMDRAARRRLIRRSAVTALVVAVVFLVAGKLVLEWMGIAVSDFLVAGGAVLFLVSIRDLLAFQGREPAPADETVGIVPIAVPLIVGPGVLTTTLLLVGTYGVLPTLFSLVSNILLCAVALYFSGGLSKLLGEAGSNTISKIANLLLAAIAVMLVRRGVYETLVAWGLVRN